MKLCKEMVEAMGGAERYVVSSMHGMLASAVHGSRIYLIIICNLYLSVFPGSVFYSQYYTRFKSYCCEAYNILRKSSNLILNLFYLMAGSNIPDIASDPEKGILKVILCSTSLYSFNIMLCPVEMTEPFVG